jgi:hypothetical protein
VIYIDSSVVLADLFTEERNPPASIWLQDLMSSRLLEYEVWNRIHVREPPNGLIARTRLLLEHVEFIEMVPAALKRALEPFPISLRTLDALHISSLMYARQSDQTIALASYDKKMLAAARVLQIPLHQM